MSKLDVACVKMDAASREPKSFKTLTLEQLKEKLDKPGSNFSTMSRRAMRQEIAWREGKDESKADVACTKMDQASTPMYAPITGDDQGGWYWCHPLTRRKFGPFKTAKKAEEECRSVGYQPKY